MQKKQSALVELLEGGPLLFKKEIQKKNVRKLRSSKVRGLGTN